MRNRFLVCESLLYIAHGTRHRYAFRTEAFAPVLVFCTVKGRQADDDDTGSATAVSAHQLHTSGYDAAGWRCGVGVVQHCRVGGVCDTNT